MSITVPEFLQSLCAASLLSEAELAALEAKAAEDSEELARELVRAGKLTKYQAAAVYQGKADTLVLGNYLILDRIGAGGMGQVFRARHRRMDRVVAIKVLSKKLLDSPDAVARFQREAKAAARLTHPNIVTAYDADEAGGTHFLVMEYVDGSDLSSLVKQQGSLPVSQALDYLLQAARGLEHAHAEGVVHRDIKPSNLLVDKKGTLKILDMGLARMSDPLADPSAVPGADLTHSGSIMGTIDYMAPEQAMDSRQADARSDIYSLGCTLHYLLTGRPPYGGDTILKRLTAHQQAAMPLLSSARADIPPGVDEVFSRMMARRPAARFQTSKELVAALDSLRNQSASGPPALIALQPIAPQPVAVPVTAIPSGVLALENIMLPRVESGSRKTQKSNSKAPLVGAALALLLAAAGGGAWMMSGGKPDETAQSEATQTTNVQRPAADLQPAAMVKSKPAAEPSKEPASVAAPLVAVQPEAMPAKTELPVNTAPQATPVAAPVATDMISTKTVPASPPVASLPVLVAAAPMPMERPTADAKLPVPGAEGRREALQLIKEVYKDDYAQAKQPETKAALAEKLLNESQQTKDDATALYCVLTEARDLAIEAANPALAERAVGMLAGRYAIDPLQELAAALEEMAGKPHPAEANRGIVDAALARIEEAQAASDFETAKRLADVAVAAARKAKDPSLSKRAIDVGKTVTAAKQQWDGWQTAQATLAQTPDDPAANLAVGRYLSTVQGDWNQGLKHLAKGPDGPLRELAAKGLTPPEDGARLAELGDAWYNAAEKAKGKDKADLRAGAAYWYTLAEPGLTSLAKAKIEKRLKELGGKPTIVQSARPGKLSETMELSLASGVSMKLRLIPAGTFTMGTPGATAIEFAHQVNVTRPFYIGVTEVTQAQWLAVVGNNPSVLQGKLDHPVEKVSWNVCQQFLDRCNNSVYARKFHFRMPTEAEWEYACRAGTTTRYYFGDDPTALPEYGWFKDNSNETTHPVGKLKPNAWGLYDTYGNVFEWCSDWWSADYYKLSPADDPQGPANGTEPIVRGGSWSNLPGTCSSTGRNYVASREKAAGTYGLRVVCEPKADSRAAVADGRAPAPGGAIKQNPRPSPSGGRPVAFAQAEIERNAANWVLSIGGKVKITLPDAPEKNPLEITNAGQLPAEPFLVYGIEMKEINPVTDKDFAKLEDLANLIDFKAVQVPIGDEGLAHVARQRNLSSLNFMNTKITDEGLASIKGLTRLHSLVAGGNKKITDAGLTHLRGLTELRSLWLNGTAITGAGLKQLQNLPEMRMLGLLQTDLSEGDLKELAPFKTVIFVNIDSTAAATDAGVAMLRAMPALSELHLEHSAVSDKGLETLATFPALKKLQLTASHVTDAGVQKFRAIRPDCEIVR